MSADALAIATQAVVEWLTALVPTTVEYRISEQPKSEQHDGEA